MLTREAKRRIADALMLLKDQDKFHKAHYDIAGDQEMAAYHADEIAATDELASQLELDPERYQPEEQKNTLYTVHAVIPVRVTVEGVEAASQEEAISMVEFELNYHDLLRPVNETLEGTSFELPCLAKVTSVEYPEGPTLHYLVDDEDDPELENSKWYAGDGKTLLDKAP